MNKLLYLLYNLIEKHNTKTNKSREDIRGERRFF